MDPNRILILDFGSQYTQLIARRIRENHVYCEIQPCTWPIERVREFKPKGIILSGSPSSVTDSAAPRLDVAVLGLGLPVLGICYGMQSMAQVLGGEVAKSGKREYGRAMIQAEESHPLFNGVREWPMPVWMSHGDRVEQIPQGFRSIARSANSPYAAMASDDGKLIGVQFHPEVVHTPEGSTLLMNFAYSVCGCEPTWTMASFVETQTHEIREKVGDGRVILGLSGGVDSSVAAVLLHRAIGDQLTCIFVDNGLLRKSEAEKVERVFRGHFHINLDVVEASERFLARLKGVEEPEQKRKIIGNEFISIFEEEARRIKDVR
ncbi:MAG: glutamine-hydrolyzing GMP synthase, partial [bacterium]